MVGIGRRSKCRSQPEANGGADQGVAGVAMIHPRCPVTSLGKSTLGPKWRHRSRSEALGKQPGIAGITKGAVGLRVLCIRTPRRGDRVTAEKIFFRFRFAGLL